jgi:superfamily II DNA or RNA helicase
VTKIYALSASLLSVPMHNNCAIAARYGTTPMPVKTEMVREFVQAGTTDLDLHLLMSGLRLKGDVDTIKTKVRQGLPTEALADDLDSDETTGEDKDSDLTEDEAGTLVNDASEDETEDRPAELPASKIENMMKGMDQIEATLKKASDLDQERLRPIVESIVTVRVNAFWQELFDAEYEGQKIAPIVGRVRKLKPSSAIAKQAQDQFLAEYEVVAKVKAPILYQGPPLRLMQRRIMFLAATRERLGNWSGTGSGKTIAALCSALHTHSGLTVVICPNPVKDTWAREIKNAFGDAVSFAVPNSDENWARAARGVHFLILNYECFQQTYTKAKITALLKAHGKSIGLFVLDECHYAKLNEEDGDESKRRQNIIAFMDEVPQAKRLAMSATPVVNNLSEAKHLIEMLTGEGADLKTRSTIRNCIAMFQALVKHGIRWKPTYREIKVCEPKIVPGTRYDSTAGKFNISGAIEIDAGPDLYAELVAEKTEKRRSFHTADVDRITLPAKLDEIVSSVGKREKAIVYTEYRDGITDVLLNRFRAEGHKVALFDGSVSDEDRNQTLAAFRLPAGSAKAVNVIVATSAITTGIDGLQHCQKLIMASLPFTHARYEQLRGRIRRPTADKSPRTITILCPIVRTNGWSSDAIRLKRIESKKDIASSTVDGTVPKFAGSSRAGLEQSILKALDKSKE